MTSFPSFQVLSVAPGFFPEKGELTELRTRHNILTVHKEARERRRPLFMKSRSVCCDGEAISALGRFAIPLPPPRSVSPTRSRSDKGGNQGMIYSPLQVCLPCHSVRHRTLACKPCKKSAFPSAWKRLLQFPGNSALGQTQEAPSDLCES